MGDTLYLSYAYAGSEAVNWPWPTRLHKVTLSLADAPMEDTSTITRTDTAVSRSKVNVVPEIISIKAERLSYTISESEHVWIMAFDSDGFVFPLLTGVRFDGYDKSVVRIVGTRIIPAASGETRVWVHWRGFTSSFVVHVN